MTSEHYEVLARKYRPKTLDQLIGQDVLTKTLRQAIEQDRVPHAILLTGIRGVGKTSTARIIAKALNYAGADGKQEMTADLKEDCEQAKAIEESRHPDVLEMDAASRTGVSDIRELIESVNYLPTMGRFKIYIIDEVHMLSKSAFNALLKTLEEPPAHCKFIFATTEVHKIPVTILSRCMRFDLPRVDSELLANHFTSIAEKEGSSIDEKAVKLIAFAAEGSVRDGLSLLDQAIGSAGRGNAVEYDATRDMLGVSDRSQLFELMQSLVHGQPKEALLKMRDMYQAGAEPVMVLQELLELSHFITQLKIMPETGEASYIAQGDVEEGRKIADSVGVPFLARLWQMLLKGVQEAKVAPNTLSAAEMILVRIAYASEMPSPGDLIKKMDDEKASGSTASAPASSAPERTPEPVAVARPSGHNLNKFSDLVRLFEKKGENFKASYLDHVHPVTFSYNNKRIEFRPAKDTPPELAGSVMQCLRDWTGERWVVAVVSEGGDTPLVEKKEAALEAAKARAMKEPLLTHIFHQFEGAEVMNVISMEEDEEDDVFIVPQTADIIDMNFDTDLELETKELSE